MWLCKVFSSSFTSLSLSTLLLCVSLLICLSPQLPQAKGERTKSQETQKKNEWLELKESDLIPLSLGSHEERVHSYIQKKEWKKAAKYLKSNGAPQRFLQAWLYAQAKDWSNVLLSLKGLETHPVLRDEVLALIAEASEALDDHRQAERFASQVSQVDVALWREVLRIRGQALRGLKQWDKAQKVYLQLLESPLNFERSISRLGLGLTSLERGLPEDALRYFKAVDIYHPSHWTSSQARQEAKKLIKAYPQLKGAWSDRSVAERVSRINYKVEQGQYQSALKQIPPLLKTSLSDDLKCKLLFLKGRSHDKLKQHSQTINTLKKAIKLCEKIRHEDTPLALYIAGRASARLNRDDESDTFFIKLFKNHKHRLSDDAAVFLVRHFLKKEKGLEKAMKLARLIPKLHPKGDLSSEALMFIFVGAMGEKRIDLATELMDLGAQLTPANFTHHNGGRFIYWRGRLQALKGKKDQAKLLYERVIHTAPLSWYALLAYSRLYEWSPKHAQDTVRQSLSWRPKGLSLPSGNVPEWRWRFKKNDPHWALMQRALMWMRLGLKRRGKRAFKELSSYKNRPDLQWLSAWALDGYGLYHWSHDILRRKLTEYRHFPPSGYLKKHWLISFPNPFKKEVEDAAKSENIEPAFIWGVMREESGYATHIQSSAKAIGLLQLLINTAKMMKTKSEEEVTVERLGIPKVNITLGARYLSWVKRKVRCAWSLVPAGYNAGGGALKRWLKERGDLPLDLFVETIPYEEARWYLKRVNASWITFRSLYGAPKGEPIWPYVSLKNRL